MQDTEEARQKRLELRADMAALPFILAGIGAAAFASMTIFASAWNGASFQSICVASVGILYFCAFWLALRTRLWSSIPLWGMSIVFLLSRLSNYTTLLAIFMIPALTELGRLIRGAQRAKVRDPHV
jgi:hypothetical protein